MNNQGGYIVVFVRLERQESLLKKYHQRLGGNIINGFGGDLLAECSEN